MPAIAERVDTKTLTWRYGLLLYALCLAGYYILFGRYYLSGEIVFANDTHGIWTLPYLMFYSLKQWGEFPWWDPTGLNGWPIYNMLLNWSYSYLNPYSIPFIASYYLFTQFHGVSPEGINQVIVFQKTIYYFTVNFAAILLIGRETVRSRFALAFIAITFTLSAITFEELRDSHQYEILPGALFYIYALLRFDRRRDLQSLALFVLLTGFYLAGAGYAVASSPLYWTAAITVFLLALSRGLFRSFVSLTAAAWQTARGRVLVIASVLYLPLTLAPSVITVVTNLGTLLRITGTQPIDYDMGLFGDWVYPYGIGTVPIWTEFLYWAPFYDLHQKLLTVDGWLHNGIHHRYVGLATLPFSCVALLLGYRHQLTFVLLLSFVVIVIFLLYQVDNLAFLALLKLSFFQNSRTISSFIPRDGGVLMLILLAAIGFDRLMLGSTAPATAEFAVAEARGEWLLRITAFVAVLSLCVLAAGSLVISVHPAISDLRHTLSHIGVYLGLFSLLTILLMATADADTKRKIGIVLLVLVVTDLTISASDYFVRTPDYLLVRNQDVWRKPTPKSIGPITDESQLWTGPYGVGSIHNTPVFPPYKYTYAGQREWLVLATHERMANLVEDWDMATTRMRAYPFFRYFTNGRYIPFDAIKNIDQVEAPAKPGDFFYLHDEKVAAAHGAPGTPIAAETHIDAWTLNHVRVSVSMPADGFMVDYDNYNRFFRAKIDGHDAPILRANFTYKALELPAGQHTVEWIYDPWPVKYAWAGLYVVFFAYLGILRWALPRKTKPARPHRG